MFESQIFRNCTIILPFKTGILKYVVNKLKISQRSLGQATNELNLSKIWYISWKGFERSGEVYKENTNYLHTSFFIS